MKKFYSKPVTSWLFAVVALLSASSFAAAQTGDICTNAFSVDTMPYIDHGTTTGFNYDYDASCFAQGGVNGAPDVVYELVADTSTAISISLCQDSTDYDTKLWVFKDTCVLGSDVACNDDACTAPLFGTDAWISTLNLYIDSGSTYYIVVGGYSDQDAGNYTIAIDWIQDCLPPSAFALDSLNDTLAVISWNTLNVGDTALVEYDTAGFVPGTGTMVSVALNSTTGMVELYPLLPGTDYDLYVIEMCNDSTLADSIGPLGFGTTAPPPANDVCPGAVTLSCDTTVSGSTEWATADDAEVPGGCGAGGVQTEGVWYHINVPQDTAVTVSTCNQAAYDTRLSVYSGACGTLVCVAGNDDNPAAGCGGFTSELTFNANAGVDYRILVHGFPGNNANGAFDLTISCGAACSPNPANDDCPDATALTPAPISECLSTSADNICAIPAMSNPSCDTWGVIADVWFSFESDSLSDITLSLNEETATNLQFAIYDGCGGNEVLCDTAANTPLDLPALDANTTYFIQVWNGGGSQEGSFDICVESSQLVGVGEAPGLHRFAIQPNPASDQLTIMGETNGERATLSLYSIRGELVRSETLGAGQLQFRQTWSVADLSKGVYIVRYQSATGQTVRRLVIE